MCAGDDGDLHANKQKRLAHKNIVSFIDSTVIKAESKQAFQSGADEVCILMEYCSGIYLHTRSSRDMGLMLGGAQGNSS